MKNQQQTSSTSENYYDVLANMHNEDDHHSDGNTVSDPDSVNNQAKRTKNNDLHFSIADPKARHVIIKCLVESNPMAFKKLDSFRKSDILEEKIGSFPSVKTLDSGSLLVETDTPTHVGDLLKITEFGGFPASAEIAYHMGTVRGVVDDASICDRSEEEVLQKLKTQHVVHVRPIYQGTGESKTRTKYTILTFRLSKLPRSVLFGRTSHRLVPYRTKVVQCERCWWFGHQTARCSRPRLCKFCSRRGEGHDSENCSSDPGTQKKCSNCSGNHPADDKSCPVWVKQLAIGKIRCRHQVGYHKATEILKKINRKTDNNAEWDGTDGTARGGRRRDTSHIGPAPAGLPGAVAADPSQSNDDRNITMSVQEPTISVGARTPSYSGAIRSPRPRSRRISVGTPNPISAQDSAIISAHGPTHSLSTENSEMDTESDGGVHSQVLPRRTYRRPLRPLPQTFNSSGIPQNDSRQPGSLFGVGEAREVPARKSILRDFGTQTDTYAHKGVQTDNLMELDAVIEILRAIPTMCKFENNTFQFSQNRLLNVLNRSLGLNLNPEYIQDALSG